MKYLTPRFNSNSFFYIYIIYKEKVLNRESQKVCIYFEIICENIK